MEHNIDWHIKAGKYNLTMMDKVNIKRSVETLVDTAVITMPGSVYNASLNIEGKIARGDKVVIQLGYNGSLKEEFSGYLERIETDDDSLRIVCEDAIFLYRVGLDDIELKNITVKKLLEYVNEKVSVHYPGQTFSLKCDYEFAYDKFIIKGMTGYDVLKKVQDEAKPNIYLKDNVLHVHPQYSETFGSAIYDFSVNIEKHDLKYRSTEDRKFLVEVEGKGADGKVVKVEEGVAGGDKMTIKISGVSKLESLKKIAVEALAAKVFTGFEGNFTGWLVPYCDAGYSVEIRDKEYEYKNGKYYVISVETTVSQQGGERVVTIGKRLK